MKLTRTVMYLFTKWQTHSVSLLRHASDRFDEKSSTTLRESLFVYHGNDLDYPRCSSTLYGMHQKGIRIAVARLLW